MDKKGAQDSVLYRNRCSVTQNNSFHPQGFKNENHGHQLKWIELYVLMRKNHILGQVKIRLHDMFFRSEERNSKFIKQTFEC